MDGPLTGQVRWFHEHEIQVCCDLSVEETVRTVAHECQHAADAQRYRPPSTPAEHEVYERRARQYEVQVSRLLLPQGW